MTEGSSQGLFIVVAIVIFGIFVVLAYILFEDTLSPAMASMFGTATVQSQLKLDGYTLMDMDVLEPHLFDTGYIRFDLYRHYTEDDTKYHTFHREWEEHDVESNIYKLSYRAYRDDKETYMGNLFRVYIQYDYDKKDEFNVKEADLRINNKKIDAKLEEAANVGANILRYFVSPYDKNISFEMNKLNVIDLYLTTEDKKIIHFQKTFIVEDNFISPDPKNWGKY